MPLRSNDRRALRHRRESASKWAFLPFVERGLTNFIRIDVWQRRGLDRSDEGGNWAKPTIST